MKILLIRHAESSNNVLSAKIKEEVKATFGTQTQRWKQEYKHAYQLVRSSDPDLSEVGVQQAASMGRFVANYLQDLNKEAVIFTSGMQRAILTAKPLSLAIGTKMAIRRDLHEVGGVYASREGKSGIVHSEERSATREEFTKKFGDIIGDVSDLPESGGWYTLGHKEDKAQAAARAGRVCNWLISKELRDSIGNKVCIIVSHGAFMDFIVKTLLLCGSQEILKTTATFAPINTSITEMEFDSKDTQHINITLGNAKHLAICPSPSRSPPLAFFAGLVCGVASALTLVALMGRRTSK
mmetsp:Transcript_15226/g.29853  ORF Transcript_15226/g.29853 Transcript_15226/m.29853 type:complete len:296 (+) Transcript_15226:46-933(+)